MGWSEGGDGGRREGEGDEVRVGRVRGVRGGGDERRGKEKDNGVGERGKWDRRR